ncbi:hypothetical protein JAAARDRAFT_196535 [Jaapia argillacea MUCL 33604]|uniref:Uncharacterized protein n=1 Tax=Jaapia argillacea MUCL 33604 TaxID=933084 RepID=A0A067PIL0_9AGAM|nr:hypothetical protein JAAARDRAFT_196535 [Jaapia argillacea MUCL 33604]
MLTAHKVDDKLLGSFGCLEFSTSGNRLVSVRYTGHIRLWNAVSGACITENPLKHGSGRDYVQLLAISPSGHYLATGSLQLQDSETSDLNMDNMDNFIVLIWDTITGIVINKVWLKVVGSSPGPGMFSHDSSQLALPLGYWFCVVMWIEGVVTEHFQSSWLDLKYDEVIFSRDGKRVAASLTDSSIFGGIKTALQIWDVEQRSLLFDCHLPPNLLDGIEFYDESPILKLLEDQALTSSVESESFIILSPSWLKLPAVNPLEKYSTNPSHIDEMGWIRALSGRRLWWIPPQFRPQYGEVWSNLNTLILNTEETAVICQAMTPIVTGGRQE